MRSYAVSEIARPAKSVHGNGHVSPAVLEATERLRSALARRRPGQTIGLSKTTNSHVYRNRSKNKSRVSLGSLNHVLEADSDRGWLEVEGLITFHDLVESALEWGCVPKVVPELRTITVGGAVTGVGVESSSFKYGLFHETVVQMQVFLANGELVSCRPDNEYRDLFFGFPNSYGTLGYLLSATVEVVNTPGFVRLEHTRITSGYEEYFELVLRKMGDDRYQFIDGVIFSPHEMVITTGEWVDRTPYLSDYRIHGVYVNSLREKREDFLTVKDYLWRWDVDSFWGTQGTVLQQPWVRRLFGSWLLRSDHLVKLKPWADGLLALQDRMRGVRREHITQDVGFPMSRCVEFMHWFERYLGKFPVWVCPVLPVQPTAYPLFRFSNEGHVDFGFYFNKEHRPLDDPNGYNKGIEAKVAELGGIKALYSTSFYEESDFWRLFNGEAYWKLKQKYDPDNVFKNLYEKTVLNH